MPQTPEDLMNLSEQYTELENGTQFLVSAEQLTEDGVALVFISDFGKRILKESQDWFMDGTFSTVPDQFSQLYVVFGSGVAPTDKIFPAAYLLLPDKRGHTYQHVLQVLKDVTDHSPTSISIDFEQAAMTAIRSVFPAAVIKGCVFHWKKSLFANVGGKGCLKLFHENEHFQVGLDLIYTLSMVPPADMSLAWEDVVEPYFEEHLPDRPEVEEYLTYCENTYVGKLNGRTGTRKNPRFPVAMWNIHERILSDEPTTNNAVESWNARWNNAHRANHNVLRVIKGFKTEDALARTKFQEHITGRANNPNPGRTDRRSGRLKLWSCFFQC